MMGDSIGFLLLIQVILIALNAIFASAEIAVLSINEAKLAHMAQQGNKKARRLEKLTNQPARFLATIQVAITLSGFLGSAFAADNFSDRLVNWLMDHGVGIPAATLDTIAVVLITLILSYFTLVFGELVPKRIAMKRSEQLALGVSGLISGISVVFRPVVWFLSLSTNCILRLCGIDPNEEDAPASEEEIRLMVDASGKRGAIDREEQEFIQNVFQFDDLTAGELATYRTDVVALWLDEDDDTWAKTIREHRHTRYPICRETLDDTVGILNTKEYFRLDRQDRASVLAHTVTPAYFVPETLKADVLFRNMKTQRAAMAVVLDEHGGMVGIVTLNDLIEELVGDLSMEDGQPTIHKSGENTWEITGNIDLREIEDAMGLTLPEGDYDTLTGLVFDLLGEIPRDGAQEIQLELGGLWLRVDHIADHQVAHAVAGFSQSQAQ